MSLKTCVIIRDLFAIGFKLIKHCNQIGCKKLFQFFWMCSDLFRVPRCGLFKKNFYKLPSKTYICLCIILCICTLCIFDICYFILIFVCLFMLCSDYQFTERVGSWNHLIWLGCCYSMSLIPIMYFLWNWVLHMFSIVMFLALIISSIE